MVLLYFFPKTSEHNGEFHNKMFQCLAYFFPAYSYSSVEHQKALAEITLHALIELCNLFEDLGDDESMLDPKKISEILADWNDPDKLAM